MFELLKKIFRTLDDASKKIERKCDVCGHVNKGQPWRCEECGADLEDKFE